MPSTDANSLCIAFGDSIKSNRIKRERVSQSQLFKILSQHEIRNGKDGPYFVFARFKKNVRNSDNVHQYYGATIDIDDGKMPIEKIKRKYSSYNYLLYTTHNHNAPNEIRVNKTTGKKTTYKFGNRYRIVIPYKKPVSPERHRKATLYLASKLGNKKGDFDLTSQDISRGMYLPSCPSSRKKRARVFTQSDKKNFNAKSSAISEMILGAEFEAFDKTTYLDLDDDVQEGGRNQTLARAIGRLIKDGAKGDVLNHLAHQYNEEKCKPPLTAKEVETTLRSIERKEDKNNKKIPLSNYEGILKRIKKFNDIEDLPRIISIIKKSIKREKISPAKIDLLLKKLSQKSGIGKRALTSELKLTQEGEDKKELSIEDYIESLKEKFKNMCYIGGEVGRFYNYTTGRRFTKDTFNAMYTTPETKGCLATTINIHNIIPKVDDLLYDPSKKEFFSLGGDRYCNRYLPPNIFPLPGDIEPILKHFEYLIPDEYERNIILDFIAHLVQKPGIKIRWMPIIKGGKGIGKTMIGRHIIRPLLGKSNMSKVSEKLLKSDFNSLQLNSQLVIFEELDIGNNYKDKLKMTNSLKDFISDDDIVAHMKSKDAGIVDNFASSLGFTNEDDCIIITLDERRFVLLKCEVEPRSIGYYKKLTRFAKNNVEEMYHYFLERDLSEFSPHKPPVTEYTLETKNLSQSWQGSILGRWISDENHPLTKAGCATLDQIIYYMKESATGRELDYAEDLYSQGSHQARQLYKALDEWRVSKYQKPAGKNYRFRIGKALSYVYLFPTRKQELQKLKSKQVRKIVKSNKTN